MKNFINWFLGINSEVHHQVYHAWRQYPLAIKNTIYMFTTAGFMLGVLFSILVKGF